jgi:GH15 family glucan-1,4-alpha-glucosidase
MTRRRTPRFEPYLPIADYAVVGNQYTTAVIARDGSVVWCCFPELKHPSVFAALLDHRKGGVFRLRPTDGSTSSWEYVDRTAVLVTTHRTPAGRLTVTDFMPIRGPIAGCEGAEGPPELHRLLRCEEGQVEVHVEWAPRFDYARAPTAIDRDGHRFVAAAAGESLQLTGLADADLADLAEAADGGPVVRAVLTLTAGQETALVTRYGSGGAAAVGVDSTRRALDGTIAAWREWMTVGDRTASNGWAGAHRALIDRATIVLKMLTHPRTGGIAAAPTTSLPEGIGGVRNWDYRYAWIRDASFTVQALLALGHSQEARDFVEFAERAAMDQSREDQDVKLMYDLHGGLAPEEETLDHLEGYERSVPVRIGNGARTQTQHDVYGELIDCAYELLRHGGSLEPGTFAFLARLADQACEVWREPDDGIWEFRGSRSTSRIRR